MDHSMSSSFSTGYGSSFWSSKLMPNSEPEMIGALIGLFLLSIGFRALVAAQGFLEAYLHLHYYPRHHARPVAHSLQREQTQDIEDDDEDEDNQDGAREKNGPSVGFEDEKLDLSLYSQPRQGQQHIPEEDHAVLTPVLLQHDPSSHHIHVEIVESPASSFPPASRRGVNSNSTSTRRHARPGHHRPSTFQSSTTSSFGLFPTPQPFVWQADVARAVLTTGVVGIGYMLMLVIMTYNSAYFGAILGGIFVGEIYFARWGRARPIFPSSSHSSSSRRADRRFDTIDFEEASRPLCERTAHSSNHTNIPPSFNSRPLETRTRQQHQIAPVSNINSSRASVISTTSSRGYSSTMVHHGADGSC